MSNNLALYTGYQYRVDVQGYEVIVVDMYIYIEVKWLGNRIDNKQ
jgi:hypothetical protein